MALLNERDRREIQRQLAALVQVTESPQLAQRYHVRAVPPHHRERWRERRGAEPEAEFVGAVIAAARRN